MGGILQRIAKALVPKSAVEAVVACLIIGVVGWMVSGLVRHELASRRGVADAQADIARGEFTYRLRGLARAWHREAIEIAALDYGVDIVRTGGCVCSEPDCAYDQAYNRAVEEHFQQTFGFDPVRKAFDLARANWDEQHDARTAGSSICVTSQSQ